MNALDFRPPRRQVTVERFAIDLIHMRKSICRTRRVRLFGQVLAQHALALLLTASEKAPARMTMLTTHIAPPQR